MAQGGPANVQIYTGSDLRRPYPSRWPREVPPTYNLYEKWLPEAISQQVAQEDPANVHIEGGPANI